ATAFENQPDEYTLTESRKREVLNRIFAARRAGLPEGRLVRLWPRIAAGIAAVITIAVCSFYMLKGRSAGSAQQPPVPVAAADIAPGKVGATLTLADGKKISLRETANGTIAKEGGIQILKTKDGQLVYEIKKNAPHAQLLNTLSTAPGETYCVVLPDQSKVWMNAASAITYTTTLLEKGLRKVKLKGEAYFEVAKDPAHPFIVETGAQLVEVLGTHFNINAYDDEEKTKTTLLEGSVKVTGRESSATIKPGEQAALAGSGAISVKAVQTGDVVAWKNGFFSFDNENLEAVMRKIARWYNVKVEYDDPSVKQETFYGSVSRFENISKVLKSLERTGVVIFQLNGNVVSVKKK
ncbi:MAG: DUF4974 domain-containing protein, partial [Niabella sp.]